MPASALAVLLLAGNRPGMTCCVIKRPPNQPCIDLLTGWADQPGLAINAQRIISKTSGVARAHNRVFQAMSG